MSFGVDYKCFYSWYSNFSESDFYSRHIAQFLKYSTWDVNTIKTGQDGRYFADDIVKYFLEWQLLYIDSKCIEICSWTFIGAYIRHSASIDKGRKLRGQ